MREEVGNGEALKTSLYQLSILLPVVDGLWPGLDHALEADSLPGPAPDNLYSSSNFNAELVHGF